MPDAARTRELARVLRLRRNVAIGLASGAAVAAGAYAYRVGELAGPSPDARGSPALFLLLAFVLAVTVASLVATLLTARRAVAVVGDDEAAGSDPPRE